MLFARALWSRREEKRDTKNGHHRGGSRQSDQRALQELGIGTGIHYPVLDHHQPAWASLVENSGTPGAEELVGRILTLPCFPSMTEEEVARVEQSLATLD